MNRTLLHNTSSTLAGLAMTLSAMTPAAAAACDFAQVKQQIDHVLDQDAAMGTKFRKEVKDGADSLTTIEDMSSPQLRDMIDLCRWDAAEYLTKRGFPPAH